MPGKHITTTTAEPCRRCKDTSSVLVVRAEPLCHPCFAKYVHTKCIKRLEAFKVTFAAQNQQRRILLPLSFGVASTTLLHILDLHLKTQMIKTGRTGFAIYVVLIEETDQSFPAAELLDKARKQYPDHQYTSLPLYDAFNLLLEDSVLRHLIPDPEEGRESTPQDRFARFIHSLPSATARADVLATLRIRLIVEHAKLIGCEHILWGDSTTRLAEKTLAETAKGRGFSLPWQLTDGASPLGVNFHYPLRDLLKKELASYIDLAESSLAALVQAPTSSSTSASTSSKNTTIDQLMMQYFESVEQSFPSIVSNVVRTMGKLEVPLGANSDPQCSLCSMPVRNGQFGIHGWGGDQGDKAETLAVQPGNNLCYGCTRSIP